MSVNRKKIAYVSTLSIVLLSVIATYAVRQVTALHQNGVIREFDACGGEYSMISDHESAMRSAEMIVYISTYYVPADGYRSDVNTEQRLNDARTRAIRQISDSLTEFTGDDSVEDPLNWLNALQRIDSGRHDDE